MGGAKDGVDLHVLDRTHLDREGKREDLVCIGGL